MDVLLFGSLGFCRWRQPRNRHGKTHGAMTAINIRIVFLIAPATNGRSRVDDFVAADRKQNPSFQSIRQQQTHR